MNKYINIDRMFSIIALSAIIFLLAIGLKASYKSNKTYESERNTYGTLMVYEKDEVTYAYQGKINIANDGTDGNDIEILIDIDENMTL